MLKLEPIEFLLRAIPEGFLFILAIYVFSNTDIEKKDYIVTSLIAACVLFMVRTLPINYGVHTIISTGLMIIVSVVKNKIDTIKAIKSALIYIICQLVAEAINFIIIENILKQDVTLVFSDPVKKSIYGIPSLIIILTLIMSYYKLYKNKKEPIDV